MEMKIIKVGSTVYGVVDGKRIWLCTLLPVISNLPDSGWPTELFNELLFKIAAVQDLFEFTESVAHTMQGTAMGSAAEQLLAKALGETHGTDNKRPVRSMDATRTPTNTDTA